MKDLTAEDRQFVMAELQDAIDTPDEDGLEEILWPQKEMERKLPFLADAGNFFIVFYFIFWQSKQVWRVMG